MRAKKKAMGKGIAEKYISMKSIYVGKKGKNIYIAMGKTYFKEKKAKNIF